MEEVKQHLAKEIAYRERMAASLDTQVVAHQRAVAEARAEAMQARGMAAELRRLLATYGPDIDADGANRAATAFSEGGQGVDTTPDEKGVDGREIKHVHVDEEPVGDALPESVWVREEDMHAHQIPMCSYSQTDVAGRKQYLINTMMLTAEQKAKYCKPAPTSDAADFGGLPG